MDAISEVSMACECVCAGGGVVVNNANMCFVVAPLGGKYPYSYEIILGFYIC